MNNSITNKGSAQLKTRLVTLIKESREFIESSKCRYVLNHWLNIDIADIDRLWGKIQSGVKLSIRVSGTVKDMPLAICFMPERKNV